MGDLGIKWRFNFTLVIRTVTVLLARSNETFSMLEFRYISRRNSPNS